METSHHKIIEFDTSARRGTVLQLGDWLRTYCREPEFSTYNQPILNACRQLHSRAKMLAGHFLERVNGVAVPPTPKNLYTRTHSVCSFATHFFV
jgi:hypothetical protein